MTKQELIDMVFDLMKLKHDRDVSKADIAALLESLAEAATSALRAKHDVTLPGLGKLQVKSKGARIGRNPRTGESVQIPAKRVPGFVASKALKDTLQA